MWGSLFTMPPADLTLCRLGLVYNSFGVKKTIKKKTIKRLHLNESGLTRGISQTQTLEEA